MQRQVRNKIMVTSVPTMAGGGIASLIKLLMEENKGLDLFPFILASPFPHSESTVSRFTRLAKKYFEFFLILIKDRSIKIVHINTAPDQKALLRDSLLIILSKMFAKKIILQIHGALNDYHRSSIVEKFVGYTMRRCNMILIFSNKDMEFLDAWIGEGVPKRIIPNAVKIDDFLSENVCVKKEMDIPEENLIILFLSRLIEQKGVFELIEAIPIVLGVYSNVTFVFAGEGPAGIKMKEACKNKDIERWVKFTGNLQYKDVVRLFRSSDIFVLPSYSEGMPMSILQALASGLPIISTPVGAMCDILSDGVNGFFVEQKNHKEIAEKILLLLKDENLRKRIAQTNIQLADKEFDVNSVCKRLSQIYFNLGYSNCKAT